MPVDGDGDGYLVSDGDCDDANAAMHPGATEACNGADDDCDATTGDAGVWHQAADGAWTELTGSFGGGTSSDAASVEVSPGAVHVCDGTWYVNLDLGGAGDYRIVGHGTEGPPVLHGADEGTIVNMGGGSVDLTVESLTLTRGLGTPSEEGVVGGGILCFGSGGSSVTVVDSTFDDNESTLGAAVYAWDCDVTVEGSSFTGNSGSYGSGIYTMAYAWGITVTITDSLFADNWGPMRGAGLAMYAFTPSELALSDTLFSENHGYVGGGAFLEGAVTATCVGSEGAAAGFHANEGSYGAALAIAEDDGGQVPTFTATLCDFGEDGAADDNPSTDIRVSADGSPDHEYGEDATFVCGRDADGWGNCW